MYRERTDDPHLDVLQDALAGEPDRARWCSLVEMLETWSHEPSRVAALSLASEAIDRWPAEVAAFPLGWLQRLLRGEALPLAALGRALRLGKLEPTGAILQTLCNAPELSRVRLVDLQRCRLADDAVAMLASSPHLRALEALDLTANTLGDPACRALADSPLSRSLRSLKIGGNRAIGVEGWAALGACDRLVELDLWNASLSEDAVSALSPLLGRLESLSLRYVGIPDALLAQLLSHCGPTLRILDLRNCKVGERTVQALAAPDGLVCLDDLSLANSGLQPEAGALLAATRFPRLRRLGLSDLGERTLTQTLEAMTEHAGDWKLDALDLSRGGLDDETLAKVGTVPLFASVRELDLSFSKLTADGLRTLMDSSLGAGLRSLSIGGGTVAFGDAGVGAIAASAAAAELERLVVVGAIDASPHNRPIGARSGDFISDAPHLGNLGELRFEFTELGDDGVAALVRGSNLGKLRRLGLSMSGVGPRGVQSLMACPWLGQLRALDLRGNRLDGEALAGLLDDRAMPMMTELELSDPPAALRERLLTSARVGLASKVELAGPSLLEPPPPRGASDENLSLIEYALAKLKGLIGLGKRKPAAPVARPVAPAPAAPPARPLAPVAELEVSGPLTDLLLLADGSALAVHSDTISSMALDGAVRWSREGGRRTEPWQPRAFLARVTSDGRLLVAYRDGALALLDAVGGATLRTCQPSQSELIHGSMALAVAPTEPVAVLVGAADSGSFEGKRDMRMVAWDLEAGALLWTHTISQRHQMLPVAPTIMADGAYYQIVEERTGGGSVVASTAVSRGWLRQGGPNEPIGSEATIRALAAHGNDLFAVAGGALQRWSRMPPRALEVLCRGSFDSSLAIAPDGSWLAALTAEGDVAVAAANGAAAGRPPRLVSLYEKEPRLLAIGAGGDLLVGYAHGKILHYRMA